MSKQPPPAPTASTVVPCPTVIEIVERPGTGRARYRLKYCLKGPLSPKQPINQPTNLSYCKYLPKSCICSVCTVSLTCIFLHCWGWSGGAKVLAKLPVPGRPTILIAVGQGPIALAVGAGGGCLDIFILIYPFSSLSPSLWETARYRLKYCLKGPLNPKQPTNQILHCFQSC